MPRPPRHLLSHSYYHIMTRGNNKNVVFRSDNDYRYFLDLIVKYKTEHPFELYHYCLMPSHTHLQIQTQNASDFSVFMKKLNLAYFHHYKKNYGWVGHFWQDRFKSQAVGKDGYFIQCGRYIELNPVRKGLTQKPEEWQYSSCSFYAQGQPDALITPDFLYEGLSGNALDRQSKYSSLLIDPIVEESYCKSIWGSDLQRYREGEKVHRKEKA
ncbi:MAG: transposase [bacterium]